MKDSYYHMNDIFPDHIEDLKFNNFSIAFGITAYDGSTESIEDPRYGRIFARISRWGFEGLSRFKEINTHICTEEELGLSDSQSNSDFF